MMHYDYTLKQLEIHDHLQITCETMVAISPINKNVYRLHKVSEWFVEINIINSDCLTH